MFRTTYGVADCDLYIDELTWVAD